MRFSDLLDSPTAAALQIEWLQAALQAVGEPGRRAAMERRPFRPGEEAKARAHATAVSALAAALSSDRVLALREALERMPDPFDALAEISAGRIPSDAALLELLRFLDAAQRADELLAGTGVPDHLEAEPAELRKLLEGGRSRDGGFYLSDGFDRQLHTARAVAAAAQEAYDALRLAAQSRVASQLGRERIESREFIVMRDAATKLPSSIRVVREAPTYFLCEIEDDEAVIVALARRDAALQSVAEVEEAARLRLGQAIRSRSVSLQRLLARLGDLDVHLAQVRFVHRYGCVTPEITSEPILSFSDARYLPLQTELEREGFDYAPIAIDLSDVAVLTGPNMGGKSAALRTCGFIATLVAFGIPVPAKFVRSAIFERIAWLGIGVQDDPESLLSSFAREVVRLKELLADGSSRMLVLVDEFARTTTPNEGRALLVALIGGLRRRGRTALMATHLPGIAREADARHFAVRGLRGIPEAARSADLESALNALAASMDFTLEEVPAGEERAADALALAKLLGLDEDIVAGAQESVRHVLRQPQDDTGDHHRGARRR